MNVADDVEKGFHVVAVKESLPKTLTDMDTHFKNAVKKAQYYFLTNRRAVDVQTMSGLVMKCDVRLSENNPDSVTVWPHGDGQMRGGIPLNRGTLVTVLFRKFLNHYLSF